MWQLSNMIYLLISYRIMLQCKFLLCIHSVCVVGVYTTSSLSKLCIDRFIAIRLQLLTLTQHPFCRSPTGITLQ